MAKTGFIADAMLTTTKGVIKPGDKVEGLPAKGMIQLKELNVVKEVILDNAVLVEATDSSQDNETDSSNDENGDK